MPAGYPGSEDRDDRKRGNSKRKRKEFLRTMHDQAAKPRRLRDPGKLSRREAKAKFVALGEEELTGRTCKDRFEVQEMLRKIATDGPVRLKKSKAIPPAARKLRKTRGARGRPKGQIVGGAKPSGRGQRDLEPGRRKAARRSDQYETQNEDERS